jgi:diaminopimelate epimerase
MKIHFSKYHGAGNDFVLIDDREGVHALSEAQIAFLCHRHFGIGADGLMLLQAPIQPQDDFYMKYYNSDGRESTMCGNGGRCIARFAFDLGITGTRTAFSAIDGPHWAEIQGNEVRLGMIDASAIQPSKGGYFIQTGSPHHVELRHAGPDFTEVARAIRNDYGPQGSNVNFVEACNNELSIRTFERGVEGETFACGTGATGAAMVAVKNGWVSAPPVTLHALGGVLTVDFKGEGPFTDVVLTGPALKVYKGTITLE